MARLKIPNRCDNEYCRRVLPSYQLFDDLGKTFYTYIRKGKKNYCDEWCADEYVSKQKHVCKYCDNIAQPIRTKKEYPMMTKQGKEYFKKIGTIISWKKVCEDCEKIPYKLRVNKVKP